MKHLFVLSCLLLSTQAFASQRYIVSCVSSDGLYKLNVFQDIANLRSVEMATLTNREGVTMQSVEVVQKAYTPEERASRPTPPDIVDASSGGALFSLNIPSGRAQATGKIVLPSQMVWPLKMKCALPK